MYSNTGPAENLLSLTGHKLDGEGILDMAYRLPENGVNVSSIGLKV